MMWWMCARALGLSLDRRVPAILRQSSQESDALYSIVPVAGTVKSSVIA
jgi:hypothetical protein